MDVTYINPFIMASKTVLNTMLGLDINVDKPRITPIVFTDNAIVIIIGITGEVRGQVLLGFNVPVACKIASIMTGSDITEIDALSESALAELGNMIMGNTSTLFSQNSLQIDITPPTVAKGDMTFDIKGAKHIMIPLTLEEDLVVELHVALKSD